MNRIYPSGPDKKGYFWQKLSTYEDKLSIVKICHKPILKKSLFKNLLVVILWCIFKMMKIRYTFCGGAD